MIKNHKLAGALADSSLYEIRRQAEYTAQWYGSQLVFADRFYPSSKTSSTLWAYPGNSVKTTGF